MSDNVEGKDVATKMRVQMGGGGVTGVVHAGALERERGVAAAAAACEQRYER